jgi:hypothetical protein
LSKENNISDGMLLTSLISIGYGFTTIKDIFYGISMQALFVENHSIIGSYDSPPYIVVFFVNQYHPLN